MEFEIEKFIKKQEEFYETALREIKFGHKESHWMWYIFPQLRGLGKTYTAYKYGIEGIEEAKLYLANDYLRNNLIKISEALLELENNDPYEVVNDDYKKLRSSMTLFYVASNNEIFKKVLDKYYGGKLDNLTLKMLNEGDTK